MHNFSPNGSKTFGSTLNFLSPSVQRPLVQLSSLWSVYINPIWLVRRGCRCRRCNDGVVSIRLNLPPDLHPLEQRYCIRWQYDTSATTIALSCQRSRLQITDNRCPSVFVDWGGIFFVYGCAILLGSWADTACRVPTLWEFSFVVGCVFRLFFVILWLVFYNGLLCLNICI